VGQVEVAQELLLEPVSPGKDMQVNNGLYLGTQTQ
jgi:hypothetical protein